ncbi:peptidylprolyl isomerase [Ahniella affigens]|uniref:Peptidyl-prolyl cis-trans isomerase n=1 Tax=Ahniella affigens TaxID=2021234 RepID=A0A2P1PMR8_9GAMM|nr:FKBP-type peptidyl-prolyl cis-trans isomerase [Ahniella affigens]AVP96132.1 peptidylprolyl isomerase [Ahniella affigens]
MKFGLRAAMLAAMLVGAAHAQDTTSEKGKLSYAIGYEIGNDFVEKKMDIDVNTVIRAIQDGYAKKAPAVANEQMAEALDKMKERLYNEAKTKYEALARDNKAASDKFLAENKVKKGIVSLPSGIQYRIIEEGTGKRPLKTSEVTMHYRGSLTTGLEFDSSFARGTPAKFKVDQVLKGWQEVIPMMKVGDHWQIFLPAEQAYGMRGNGPIGPNQALVFEIKLIDVK